MRFQLPGFVRLVRFQLILVGLFPAFGTHEQVRAQESVQDKLMGAMARHGMLPDPSSMRSLVAQTMDPPLDACEQTRAAGMVHTTVHECQCGHVKRVDPQHACMHCLDGCTHVLKEAAMHHRVARVLLQWMQSTSQQVAFLGVT